MTATDSPEAKARELRAFYRQSNKRGEPWTATKAEFERLFGRPPESGEAEQMVTHAWTEARELAEQTYDYAAQCWRDRDGNRVV